MRLQCYLLHHHAIFHEHRTFNRVNYPIKFIAFIDKTENVMRACRLFVLVSMISHFYLCITLPVMTSQIYILCLPVHILLLKEIKGANLITAKYQKYLISCGFVHWFCTTWLALKKCFWILTLFWLLFSFHLSTDIHSLVCLISVTRQSWSAIWAQGVGNVCLIYQTPGSCTEASAVATATLRRGRSVTVERWRWEHYLHSFASVSNFFCLSFLFSHYLVL